MPLSSNARGVLVSPPKASNSLETLSCPMGKTTRIMLSKDAACQVNLPPASIKES